MGFTSSSNTGSDTGDKYAKEVKSPSFGDKLVDYAEHRYPIAGGLMAQVFGQPQAPVQHDTYGFGTPADHPVSMPDQSQPQSFDSSAPMAKGLPISTIAKFLMGA